MSLMDLERWIMFLKISIYISQKNESRLVGNTKFITSVFFSDKLIFKFRTLIHQLGSYVLFYFIYFMLFFHGF